MFFFVFFFWVVHFCLKLSAWLDCHRCQSSSRSTLCGWFSSCCGSSHRCPNRGKFRCWAAFQTVYFSDAWTKQVWNQPNLLGGVLRAKPMSGINLKMFRSNETSDLESPCGSLNPSRWKLTDLNLRNHKSWGRTIQLRAIIFGWIFYGDQSSREPRVLLHVDCSPNPGRFSKRGRSTPEGSLWSL